MLKLFFKKHAFTLTELLLVIAILAVFSVSAFYGVQKSRTGADNSKRLDDLVAVANVMEQYRLDHGGLFPSPFAELGRGQTLLCFDKNAAYVHDCSQAAFIQGFLDEKVLGKNYLPEVPVDPETGSRYVFGVTGDGAFYQAATIYRGKDGWEARTQGNLEKGFELPSIIRAYDGPSFVTDRGSDLPYPSDPLALTATARNVSGTVTASGTPVTSGQILAQRAAISTIPDGKVDLYFSDGSVTSVDENTTLELKGLEVAQNDKSGIITKIKLLLTSGKLWTKAARLSRGSEFSIEASGAIAGVRGTEFGLSVIPGGGSAALTVLSGKVALSPSATALAGPPGGAPFFFADSDTIDPAENGDVVTGLFVDVAAGGPAGAGVGTATARELTPAEKALIRQRYYGPEGTASAEGPRITDMSVPLYVIIPKNLEDSSTLDFHVRPNLEGYDPAFGLIQYAVTSGGNDTATCWGSGTAEGKVRGGPLALPFAARLPAGAAEGECLLRLTLTLPTLPNPVTLTEEKTVTVKRYDQDWDPVRQMTVPSAEDAGLSESSLETGYGAYLEEPKAVSGVSETALHVSWILRISDHALLDMTLTDTADPPHVFHTIQDLTGAEAVDALNWPGWWTFSRDIPKSNFSLTEENHLKLKLRYIRLKDILKWKGVEKPEELGDAAAVEAARQEAIAVARESGNTPALTVSMAETSFSFGLNVPTVLRMGFTDSAGNPVTAPPALEPGTTLPLRLKVLDSNEETLPANLSSLNRYCAWSVTEEAGGPAPDGVSVTNDGVVIASSSAPPGPLTVTCTFPPPVERTLLDLGGREYKVPDQLLWEKQTVEVTPPQISVTGLQVLAGPNPVPDNHNVLLNAVQGIRYGLSLTMSDGTSRPPDSAELALISCTRQAAGETSPTAVTFNSASSDPPVDPFTFDISANTPAQIAVRCETGALNREFTVFVHRPTADGTKIYSVAGQVGPWGSAGPDGTFGTNDDITTAVNFCAGLTEGGVTAGTWSLPTSSLLANDTERAVWCNYNPSLATDRRCQNMPIGAGQSQYWTNEEDTTNTTRAFKVAFTLGFSAQPVSKTSIFGYRCVRSTP